MLSDVLVRQLKWKGKTYRRDREMTFNVFFNEEHERRFFSEEAGGTIKGSEISTVQLVYAFVKTIARNEHRYMTSWVKERIDNPDQKPLYCTEDLQLTHINEILKRPVVKGVFTDPINQSLIEVALKSLALLEKRLCVPTVTRHDESLIRALKVMSNTLGSDDRFESDLEQANTDNKECETGAENLIPVVSVLQTEVNYYRAIAKKMTQDLISTAELLNRYKEDVHIGRSIHSVLSESIDAIDKEIIKTIKTNPFYQQDISQPIIPSFNLNECDDRVCVPHAKFLKDAGINNLHDLAMLTHADYFSIPGVGKVRRGEIEVFLDKHLPLFRAQFHTGVLRPPAVDGYSGYLAISSDYAQNLRMERNYEWTVPKALRPTRYSPLAVLGCNLAHYGDNGDPYHANIIWLERKAEPDDQAKENLRSIHPFELRF